MSVPVEAVDGEVVEQDEPVATELVRAPSLAVTPQVTAADLVARLAVIKEAMHSAMEEGVDYGKVPGTDKPTLFKPGAEKLNVLFQLDVQLVNEKIWGPGDHLTVISHATAYHAPTGSRLGFGEGICTTRERKYAYRRGERICPNCGKAAIIKGKAEFGGGWLCWAKKDGCGGKWPDGAPEIEGQQVGDVENPDLPDLWNTIVKMAEKRARIDAVLAVTGASALFTQDMDDGPLDDPEPPAAAPKPVIRYVDFLRGAIRERQPDQLKDDAEWAALLNPELTAEEKREVVATLEQSLAAAGGDVAAVKARYEAAVAA